MSGESGLSLRSIEDVERMARIAVASGFTACRKPEEAAVILLTGQELGLSPMQSLRGIYVVSGKPVLSADTMVAVVRRSGLCESWRSVESTPERCEIWTLRKGDEVVSKRVWTMADAKRAGVTGKSTWAQYPAAMLRHRCAADLAREVYPDVILGMYDPEEMEPAAPSQPLSLAQLGIEVQQHPTLPAPSSWSTDLAACDTLVDVRGAYRASVRDDTAGAMRDDVRAWLAERGIPGVTAAESTALLSTVPEDALRVLSELWLDEDLTLDERCITAARAVKAAQWDAHSQKTAHAVVTRCYAHATGAGSIREAGAAMVAARDPAELPAVDAATRERIASKSTRPALVNSIRSHAAEVLASDVIAELYAAQWAKVCAVADDPRPLTEQHDDALARVITLAKGAAAKPARE